MNILMAEEWRAVRSHAVNAARAAWRRHKPLRTTLVPPGAVSPPEAVAGPNIPQSGPFPARLNRPCSDSVIIYP